MDRSRASVCRGRRHDLSCLLGRRTSPLRGGAEQGTRFLRCPTGLTLLAVLVWAALVGICDAQTPQPVTVTFYHTSDIHEHSGGLPRIARLVAEKKKADPNVLFVDTGDWCNKGDLTPLNTRGEAIVEMLSAAKYDAVIPGNHDFTFGGRRLAELADKYSLPLLAANCQWDKDVKPRCAASHRIYKLRGVTVGIIGTAPPFVGEEEGPSVRILPIAEAVKPLLAEVAAQTDIVVLMTHVGPPEDQKLVEALPRVDILFGGHHHKQFAKLNFDRRTNTILQHSGCFGQTVGEVTVTWDGRKITDRKLRLIRITEDMPAAEAVQAIADKYLSRKPASAPVVGATAGKAPTMAAQPAGPRR